MTSAATSGTTHGAGAGGDGGHRTRRWRGLSSRTVARILLAVIVVGTPTLLGLVALDMFDVRSDLRQAQASLREVRGALGEVEIDEARVALDEAEVALEDARSRTGSIRWSLASVAPVVGHSVDATREVVETASAAVEVASIGLAGGEELIGRGLDIEMDDGQVDLAPLFQARDLVEQLPIERLEAAHADLAEPPPGWVPRPLLDGRADTLELADGLLETVTNARALTTALPGFLGEEGPRRYFVGMQTSAELRGTGGLIGFWGILAVDDGQVTFGQSAVYDPFDDTEDPAGETRTGRIGHLSGPLDVGVEADPAFHERYAYLLGTSSFSNVNLDPDLPTTARVALDLFTLRTGARLDGMILLDPAGLQALLEATGPTIPVSADASATLGLDGELPTGDFARYVTSDIYDVVGFGRDGERNDILRELGDTAFLQVFDGQWDGVEMVRAIVDAGAQRHLQVYSEDEAEQTAFEDVGVTGSLSPGPSDLLAVTANNAVGGKQDVHLGHELDLDVRLGEIGRTRDGDLVAERAATLGVTVDNPLPSSGMDEYVIGNCFVVGDTNRCFEGPPGWNWTWFNTWLPSDTRVVDTRIAEDSMPPTGPRSYRGFRVLDHFHATPPESRASFEVDTDGVAPLTRTPTGYRYEWTWWRQAKATPDLLDVRVTPPEGWAIDDVEIAGGGRGRGSGVHGEGVELTVEVEGGAARLTGTVTADTRLRVDLVSVD